MQISKGFIQGKELWGYHHRQNTQELTPGGPRKVQSVQSERRSAQHLPGPSSDKRDSTRLGEGWGTKLSDWFARPRPGQQEMQATQFRKPGRWSCPEKSGDGWLASRSHCGRLVGCKEMKTQAISWVQQASREGAKRQGTSRW